MDFSLGLPKLHEHPLPDEDALLDAAKCVGTSLVRSSLPGPTNSDSLEKD